MHCVRTFEQFRYAVGQPYAVRVAGRVVPYRCPELSCREVLLQAREEPQARICTGIRGEALDTSLEAYPQDFRALPIEEALRAPVHLSLFDLGRLRQSGGALKEVVEQVYLPLTRLWAENGLYWKRVYPILFLSGPGCSTNYHWDPSSVLFIQLWGRKRFYALNDPRRWLPLETASLNRAEMVRPEGLGPDDARVFEVNPGEALWSPSLAPHWVDADDLTTFSLSIAFTDIGCEPTPDRVMEVV